VCHGGFLTHLLGQPQILLKNWVLKPFKVKRD